MPIIILTGFGNIATAVAAVKAGALDYLPPANPDAIEQALLQRRQFTRTARRSDERRQCAGNIFSVCLNNVIAMCPKRPGGLNAPAHLQRILQNTLLEASIAPMF